MPFSVDLFPEYQLLDWLPDESFFSFASRHHYLWGHATSARTCELLFGHERGGVFHDFPNHLQVFVDRTDGRAGDVDGIARERTLIKFYRAFISSQACVDAVACLAGPSVAHLKMKLGILTSRYRANHPLKACMACMKLDVEERGWAYWHLRHQYPGVWVCTQHHELLWCSVFKATGVQRFQWLLPREEELRASVVDAGLISDQSFERLLGLAYVVEGVVDGDMSCVFRGKQLDEIYRSEVERHGWRTTGGTLHRAQISREFLEYLTSLRTITEFSGLSYDETVTARWLARLLQPSRTRTHPLSHLMLVHWMFGSVEKFRDAIVSFAIRHRALGEGEGRCADLVIPSTEERKQLSPQERKAVLRELGFGRDQEIVAAKAGISLEAISQLLESNEEVRFKWVQAREKKARARDQARATWLESLESSRALGVKQIRSKIPSVYAWLYRNDRNWLNEHKPSSLPSGPKIRGQTVDWVARDSHLSGLVRSTALWLVQEKAVQRIHFWQLYQYIPELHAKKESLHRLPLTRQAIQDVLKVHRLDTDLFT